MTHLLKKKYKNAVRSLKNNYIYQICRSSEKKKKEQIELIEHIVKDGKAKLYFKEQKRIIVKEKINSNFKLSKRNFVKS